MSAPYPLSSVPSTAAPALLTRDFALLLAVQLVFGFAFSTFLLLPKFVVTELAGTPSQVGAVSAIAALSSVLAAPLSGALLDRGGRRPLMLAGALLTALTSAAFLTIDALGPFLYAVRAVQGISFTLFFAAAATLAADLAPPARLAQALGWFGAAALMMNAVATVASEQLAHRYGWFAVFGAATLASVLASALALLVREAPSSAESERAPARALPSALSGRFAIYWAAAAGGVAFGVMITFTQPLALSLGETNVSPLFAGYTAAALLVRLVFGNLADRYGRAPVAMVALLCYALVVAATAGLFRGSLVLLGLGFGLAHGVYYPSLNALALQGVQRARRGSTTGYFLAAFYAGVLGVSYACGHLAEELGLRFVFLLTAVITSTGALSLWSMSRRKSLPARAF